jgi:hypothetical protein
MAGAAVVGLLGALALVLGASPAAAAGHHLKNREVSIEVQGRATNQYQFEFSATKTANRKYASIQIVRDGSTAFYLARHPRRVSPRRISADFGGLGHVSLRLDRGTRGSYRGTCTHGTISFAKYRGAIRFDGESGYTRIRERQPAAAISIFGTEPCGNIVHLPREREQSSILGTCGAATGPGFFAAEETPGGPSSFLGSSLERSKDLVIFRSVIVDGPAKALKIPTGRSSAVVRPPEPFIGRAKLEGGQLTGNLRVLLPGAGLSRLTPATGDVASFRGWRPPQCFPYQRLLRDGSGAAARLSRVIDRASRP